MLQLNYFCKYSIEKNAEIMKVFALGMLHS